MILNVSGRCDIVAFFSEWFMNRYKEGFVDVRNPFYEKKVSRIFFKDVDAIVFCTKNPIPILKYLKEIEKPILFQVTLTPYQKDIEPYVCSKKEIIKAIRELSSLLEKDYLYIRYDPIFLSEKYTLAYHIRAFTALCELLDGYVTHFIVSFLDDYKNVRANAKVLQAKRFSYEDFRTIGTSFSEIAKKHHMTVQTCAEEFNLVEFGFRKEDCLSKELAQKLTGKNSFKKWQTRGKKTCHCVEMVDIGVYNCCKHFCKYCYANYDEKKVEENLLLHDPSSSFLVGTKREDDIMTQRK